MSRPLSGYFQRGGAWADKKERDKAVEDYTEAIRLRPDYPAAYLYRGVAREKEGDWDRAMGDYTEAIRLNPDRPFGYSGRAWVLATCPDARYRDGAKAVADARRACELARWKAPFCLSTLAAAYAESGQFDEAVKWQRAALENEFYAKWQGDRAPMRLSLYEQKMPYREPKP